MLDSLIEDINSIICGTTARQSLVGDDSRISAATEIESSSTMVILSQQLQMHLRHSVHCGGSHDSLIRSHLLRSWGTESTNSRRNVQTALVLTSHIDDVLASVNIHLKSLLGHLLTNRRQKSTKVNNPRNSVLSNQTSDVALVSYIEESRRSRSLELSVRETQIRGNDVLNTVLLTED